MCRHGAEINTQEGKHPRRLPVRTQSTYKQPAARLCPCSRGGTAGPGGSLALAGPAPDFFCARKSHVGLCGAPKSRDAQGERTGGIWCHLWVGLAAAFKGAHSIFLLSPPKCCYTPGFCLPGGCCHLQDTNSVFQELSGSLHGALKSSFKLQEGFFVKLLVSRRSCERRSLLAQMKPSLAQPRERFGGGISTHVSGTCEGS